jgi:hypothetical protein
MEPNQIHRAEQIAANSDSRNATNSSVPNATISWIAAGLLILLGVAFELGMLGFGPYNSSDVWLFSVIGKNAWIALTNLALPELREIVRIWPMVLVSLGSAILLIARRWSHFNSSTAASSGRNENHAN